MRGPSNSHAPKGSGRSHGIRLVRHLAISARNADMKGQTSNRSRWNHTHCSFTWLSPTPYSSESAILGLGSANEVRYRNGS
jgi:hypothetical protein